MSDGRRAFIRKGGVVDGEQYYVLCVDNTTEFGDSAAFTKETIEDFIDKAERVLDGELRHGAVDVGEL